MIKTEDPIRDYTRWDEEQFEKEQQLPVCCECGKRISDEFYYEIAGRVHCENCVEAAKKYNDL